MLARLRTGRRHDGAAAVEFAIVSVLFLALVFGVIQYGFYFFSKQAGSSVASRYVRQMSVGNCQNAATLKNAVYGALTQAAATTAASTSDPDFSVTSAYVNQDGTSATASTVTVGGTVTLTIQFPTLNLHFPFVPFLNQAIVSRQVTAQVENNTAFSPGACA
jgi:Flp pilus assembly protein TadG